MQGKPEVRIKLLENALKLKPNYTVAHNNLGNALQEKGDLDAAIISYKTAIQPARLRSSSPNLSITLQKRGDLAAAIDAYRTALRLCELPRGS